MFKRFRNTYNYYYFLIVIEVSENNCAITAFRYPLMVDVNIDLACGLGESGDESNTGRNWQSNVFIARTTLAFQAVTAHSACNP